MMSMSRAAMLAAIVSVTLAACASAGTTAPAPASGQERQDWQIVFQLSGGFAGMDRVLEVGSAGSLVASDRRRRERVTGKVSGAELSRLATMIRQTYAATPRDTPCPDCRIYDLALRDGERSSTYQLTDTNRAGHALDPLLTALTDLLDRALTGRLAAP